MSVLGFDIGNQSCVIAAATRDGVDVLLNDESKHETPAVVSFGEKQRFMGSAGASVATFNPKSTVSQIKRLIGKVYKEVEEDLKMLPFVTSEGPRGGILIEFEYLKTKRRFTPVEILGMLFKHLKQIAEKNLESSVVDCVIGIPSYFSDLQRRLYLDAAFIAGLKPLKLMHDGTAIALGYGMNKTDLSNSGPTYVMFVDIGHCDTQVTVAAFEQGGMKILAHSFDQNLGGRDFDEVLYKYFAAQFNEKYKIDVFSHVRASVRLRLSCEKVKKVLSTNTEAPLSIECLVMETDVRGFITREEFENLSSELFKRVIVPCKTALDDSGLRVEELYTTELVGSGSRIPAITRILTSFLKKEPTRTLNASECVARGCALHCAMLSLTLKVRDYKISESFPYTIIIPSPQGDCAVFPKGSSYPDHKSMKHTRNIPFYLQVAYIKERHFPTGISHIVGHFGIGSPEHSNAKKANVEFNVKLNGDGIVKIDSATILDDTRYNIWKRVFMADSYMLKLSTTGNVDVSTTKDELHEAEEKEKTLTEQDLKMEKTKDQRNTLESFVDDTCSKLFGAYRSFATDREKEELTKSIQETEDLLYDGSDDEAEQDYAGKFEDLKKLLEPVEIRYMEEKAIPEATKTLQACIAKYRPRADSLPADKQENFKTLCTDAEQWLIGLSQNHLSPKDLLTEISRHTETFDGKCKNIISSIKKDQRNTLKSFVDETRNKLSGAYRHVATDREEEELTKNLQEVEDWLYEDSDDEAEQDYTGKLKDLKKLLEPIENRYMEEKAITEATKTLQACIAKYHSVGDSLPADKQENVKTLCTEAEQWLSDLSQKHLSPKDLLTEISRHTETFDGKCKNIIRSIKKAQKNTLKSFVDETRSKLSDAYLCVATGREEKELTKYLQETEDRLYEDSDDEAVQDYAGKLEDLKKLLEPIENRYMEEKAIAEATITLQTCIAKYRMHANLLAADKKERVKNLCTEAEQWLSGLSQKHISPKDLLTEISRHTETFDGNCEIVIDAESSSFKQENLGMSVIGFDIGNESCVIAAVKRGGVNVLLNDEAKLETPAVVSFGQKQRSMGSAGAAFATANPKSTISQIKRLIGKVYKEVEEELKLLPFVTSEGPRGSILIELEYLKKKWTFTPVEILGMLFKHLKQIAEKNRESSVVDCVIGIPSYFSDLQRRLYLDAAFIAGLRPLRLMHDGTAIALGYGMYKNDLSDSGPTYVMFVDIGHCDTQVTVSAFEQGGMNILSHSFDENLGGRDFDEVLFNHFAAQFNEKYKIDIYSNARASVRLRASCEKVKKVLSVNAEAPLSIECLIGDTDVRGIITREEFENLSSKLLERAIVPCMMALMDSGLSVDELYTIELVGSGSRIPAISRILTSFLKKEPTRTLNASECVARGCALRCAMLSPTIIVRDYKIKESFPYVIVITSPKREYMVFPKGSSFPNQKMIMRKGNSSFDVQVAYIKERSFPTGLSHIVGRYRIWQDETSDAEKGKVEFSVKLNDHGIVEIDFATILIDKLKSGWSLPLNSLVNTTSSHTLNLSVSKNLKVSTTNEELHEAKEKEKTLTEQDLKMEKAKDQRNTLKSFVDDTRKLSGAYRFYATDSESAIIFKRFQETEDWLYEDSDDESEQDYTVKLNDLKKLLEPIVNRYMEEKAITEATKTLQACVAKYGSVADSLPDEKKDNVKNACTEVEQWLKGLSQKHLSSRTLLTELNRVTELVDRECGSITRSKSSSSNHEKPMDSDQKDQPVDSENARLKAIKTLQGHIAKYRMRAESLPDDKKDKVKHECISIERWLDDTLNKNLSPSVLEAHIHHVIKVFKRNCETVIRSESSSPRHVEPEDSNQSDQPVESYRKDQPVDFENARLKAIKPLQDHIAKYRMRAESLSDDKKEKVKSVCISAEQWLTGLSQLNLSPSALEPHINRAIEGVERNCELIIRSKSSSQRHEELEGSNQRDQRVHSDQRDQRVDSDQRDQRVDSDQWDQLMTLDNQPVDSDQRDQPVDSDQRDQPMDSDQWDALMTLENQPVDSDQRDKPVDSDQWDQLMTLDDQPVDSDQWDQPVDSAQRDQPVDSDQWDQPVDSDQWDQPVDSAQRDQPVDSVQRDQPVDSDQRDQLMQFDILPLIPMKIGNLYFSFTNSSPVDSAHRNQPVDSDQWDQTVDSAQRDQPVDSDQWDQLMTLDGQPVDSDQRDQPVDSDQRDQPRGLRPMGPTDGRSVRGLRPKGPARGLGPKRPARGLRPMGPTDDSGPDQPVDSAQPMDTYQFDPFMAWDQRDPCNDSQV